IDTKSLWTVGNVSRKAGVIVVLGLGTTIILIARRVNGAILIGILVGAVAGLFTGIVKNPGSVLSVPPSVLPTAFQLDVWTALKQNLIAVILIFFCLDLFDTVGSLIGIAKQAGLMKEGKLPRAGRALLADAIGTVGSALSGNTTMVSYIESAAGVAVGGRTGLAALVTAGMFVIAMFFSPIVQMISGGLAVQEV